MAPEYLLNEFHRSGEFHTQETETYFALLQQEPLNIKVHLG
jgi:hypothetical protein